MTTTVGMYTMSASCVGRTSFKHDERTPEQVLEARRKNPKAYANIDVSRTGDNVVFKSAEGKTEREAYNAIFEDELAVYNKGKRPCRQIRDYYQHVKDDGRRSRSNLPILEECVFTLGNKDEHPDDETALKIFEDVYEKLSKLDGIEIMSAVVHLDESEPHLHVSYAYVSPSNGSRGLAKRGTMTPAMSAMGFETSGKADKGIQAMWWDFLRDQLEEVSAERGIRKLDGKSAGKQRMSVNAYKAFKAEVEAEKRVLDVRELGVRGREVRADRRDAELDKREAELDERAGQLDKFADELAKREAELDARDAAGVVSVVAKAKQDAAQILLDEQDKLSKELDVVTYNRASRRMSNVWVDTDKRLDALRTRPRGSESDFEASLG